MTSRRLSAFLAGLTCLLLPLTGCASHDPHAATTTSATIRTMLKSPHPDPAPDPVTKPAPMPQLPGGGYEVFHHNFLVAYYGTAGTAVLGVLGSAGPDQIMPRLIRAAKPFARPGRPTQPVFELIASVAQGAPGPDHDYSADIPRSEVQEYIAAAHRHHVLLILDLQTGRSDFLTVARRWAWALKDPWVGLALDPEWRMGPHGNPAHVIGSVGAAEVNRTSAWLNALTAKENLPQKIFLLHEFRPQMIRHIGDVHGRSHLVMVQHIDGFGTPGQKLATYRSVARPHQFRMGFKLFYRQDRPRMSAAQVERDLPRVRFVSFQ